MWFEILPSIIIVMASVAVPHGLAYIYNKILNGNMYRRDVTQMDQQLQYLRDVRLTKDAYKMAGLENIPDGNDGEDDCEFEEIEEECDEEEEPEFIVKKTKPVYKLTEEQVYVTLELVSKQGAPMSLK